MIKKIFLFALLFAALFGLYKSNIFIKREILSFSNTIKMKYLSLYEEIDRWFTHHIHQAQTIDRLQQENRELYKYKILYDDLQNRYDYLQKDCNLSLHFDPHLEYVRAISYRKLGDFTSMWLDAKLEKEKIYGLLHHGFVAGIARRIDDKAVAFLNGNKLCSYGVFIGEGHVQGIAMGTGDNRAILVKYIPNYEYISIGDRVVTSGLDNIFIYGLLVGEVMKIWQEGSYKVAKVRVYDPLKNPRYFWLMKL